MAILYEVIKNIIPLFRKQKNQFQSNLIEIFNSECKVYRIVVGGCNVHEKSNKVKCKVTKLS